jgi:hypothetical protein
MVVVVVVVVCAIRQALYCDRKCPFFDVRIAKITSIIHEIAACVLFGGQIFSQDEPAAAVCRLQLRMDHFRKSCERIHDLICACFGRKRPAVPKITCERTLTKFSSR